MLNFQEFLGGAQRKLISINRNGESDLPKGRTSWTSVMLNSNTISIIILLFDQYHYLIIWPIRFPLTLSHVPKYSVLHMDPDWSFIDFLNAASQRLDLVPSAKRVFNANGKPSMWTYILMNR